MLDGFIGGTLLPVALKSRHHDELQHTLILQLLDDAG
jgi:hypothetical protein